MRSKQQTTGEPRALVKTIGQGSWAAIGNEIFHGMHAGWHEASSRVEKKS